MYNMILIKGISKSYPGIQVYRVKFWYHLDILLVSSTKLSFEFNLSSLLSTMILVFVVAAEAAPRAIQSSCLENTVDNILSEAQLHAAGPIPSNFCLA